MSGKNKNTPDKGLEGRKSIQSSVHVHTRAPEVTELYSPGTATVRDQGSNAAQIKRKWNSEHNTQESTPSNEIQGSPRFLPRGGIQGAPTEELLGGDASEDDMSVADGSPVGAGLFSIPDAPTSTHRDDPGEMSSEDIAASIFNEGSEASGPTDGAAYLADFCDAYFEDDADSTAPSDSGTSGTDMSFIEKSTVPPGPHRRRRGRRGKNQIKHWYNQKLAPPKPPRNPFAMGWVKPLKANSRIYNPHQPVLRDRRMNEPFYYHGIHKVVRWPTALVAGRPTLPIDLGPDPKVSRQRIWEGGRRFIIDTGTSLTTMPNGLYDRLEARGLGGIDLGDGRKELQVHTAAGPVKIQPFIVQGGKDDHLVLGREDYNRLGMDIDGDLQRVWINTATGRRWARLDREDVEVPQHADF